MNKKILIASFGALVVLLVIAGALELLLAVLPASSDGGGSPQVSSAEAESKAGESSPTSTSLPTDEEIRAAELVKTGDIAFDGKPLQRGDAENIVLVAGPYASRVEYVDQLPILSSGCEIVSLAVAMRAEGISADPVAIADDHLSVGNDFSVDYVGSPRDFGGGLPPSIVVAGNSWLRSRGEKARVVDLTGTTFEGVADLVGLGYPVLVWTTEDMVDPIPSGNERNGLRWYEFEHCVVVCGFTDDGVIVADPLVGKVTRDRASFERIYLGCGNMAAFVLPDLR